MADIEKSLNVLNSTFQRFVENKEYFEVCQEKDLPYGLKPHTRSICWLAEQVINQDLKKNKTEYKIYEIQEPDSDISAWDSKIIFNGEKNPIFINIKVTDISKPVRRNDIASVQKLITFYEENPKALLFYVALKLKFNNRKIQFVGHPIVRYYPWISEFVVNSRNHHIQSYYECKMIQRTVEEFVSQIKAKAKGRISLGR